MMFNEKTTCSVCGNLTQVERSLKKDGKIWCEFCVAKVKKKRDNVKYKKRLMYKKRPRKEIKNE